MSKVYNFNKGIVELCKGLLMIKKREEIFVIDILEREKMTDDRLEDLAYQYGENYSRVFNLFHYEQLKLKTRDVGLVRGFFSNSSKYDEKTLAILKRYYRRETSKYL